MSNSDILFARNRVFAETFPASDLPIVPKLRTVILTCVDARVDPAHVLGLDLGDAVVIRNNGGRVTEAVIQEIATLAFMVKKMDGDRLGPFEVVIMHHTQCGAERFADPKFQHAIMESIGVDVSGSAISNHEQSIREDIAKLSGAGNVPGYVVVSGAIYNVVTGSLTEVVAPSELGQARPA
ncbi:carbonic anhydrase [Ruegeria arenilitoris]|uniref:carbonic anhydrase n=1 Tax=Ruegeria arenilitoris TaxID=1173585 RepID=UPI00147E77B8|nr:carbonic anhydrase [Ruegeria arenilitoris]